MWIQTNTKKTKTNLHTALAKYIIDYIRNEGLSAYLRWH